jgi:hypothetical protein
LLDDFGLGEHPGSGACLCKVFAGHGLSVPVA